MWSKTINSLEYEEYLRFSHGSMKNFPFPSAPIFQEISDINHRIQRKRPVNIQTKSNELWGMFEEYFFLLLIIMSYTWQKINVTSGSKTVKPEPRETSNVSSCFLLECLWLFFVQLYFHWIFVRIFCAHFAEGLSSTEQLGLLYIIFIFNFTLPFGRSFALYMQDYPRAVSHKSHYTM